jgi:hypothetical protein
MYNSLRLRFAFDKRQPHFAADKRVNFFAAVEGVFTRGFWGNMRFRRGVFVVKLWCFGGESWCVDGRFFGA